MDIMCNSQTTGLIAFASYTQSLSANIPIMPAKPMLCLAYQSIRKDKVQLLLQPQLWQRIGQVSSMVGPQGFPVSGCSKSSNLQTGAGPEGGDGFVYRLIMANYPHSIQRLIIIDHPPFSSGFFEPLTMTDHDRPMSQESLPIRRQGAVSWRAAATCPPGRWAALKGYPSKGGPLFGMGPFGVFKQNGKCREFGIFTWLTFEYGSSLYDLWQLNSGVTMCDQQGIKVKCPIPTQANPK